MEKTLKWRKAFIADNWQALKGIEIAELTGMSPKNVSKLGHRMGPPKKRDLTQSKRVKIDDILPLLAKGYTQDCIGAHLGVSHGVIYRKLRQYRLEKSESPT